MSDAEDKLRMLCCAIWCITLAVIVGAILDRYFMGIQ